MKLQTIIEKAVPEKPVLNRVGRKIKIIMEFIGKYINSLTGYSFEVISTSDNPSEMRGEITINNSAEKILGHYHITPALMIYPYFMNEKIDISFASETNEKDIFIGSVSGEIASGDSEKLKFIIIDFTANGNDNSFKLRFDAA